MLYADVTHFDETDPEVHPAAWKLAEHIRGVIRAATAIPTGYTLESALPCRRRPGHRKCPGWIRVDRQDIPPYVNWECSNCQDSGLVRNWEDSPYDLRPPRRLDEPGLLSIQLTDDEHAELRRLELLDLDSERVVWSAYRDGGRLLLVGTEDDVDNLVGFIAFEANHMADRRRQRRLDQVIGKLEGALRSFG